MLGSIQAVILELVHAAASNLIRVGFDPSCDLEPYSRRYPRACPCQIRPEPWPRTPFVLGLIRAVISNPVRVVALDLVHVKFDPSRDLRPRLCRCPRPRPHQVLFEP